MNIPFSYYLPTLYETILNLNMLVRFCKLTKLFKRKKTIQLVIFNSLYFSFYFTCRSYIKVI